MTVLLNGSGRTLLEDLDLAAKLLGDEPIAARLRVHRNHIAAHLMLAEDYASRGVEVARNMRDVLRQINGGRAVTP